MIWLLKKDESVFLAEHAKEALNFQISLCIYFTVAILLCFVLIGLLLVPVLFVFALVVVMMMAGFKANGGQAYRYPLCIRFLS